MSLKVDDKKLTYKAVHLTDDFGYAHFSMED